MPESTMTISELGNKFWRNSEGKYHRLDGPAVEWKNGRTIWYIDNGYLGTGLNGFWKLWKHLDEEQRQNINLHMWLARLTKS